MLFLFSLGIPLHPKGTLFLAYMEDFPKPLPYIISIADLIWNNRNEVARLKKNYNDSLLRSRKSFLNRVAYYEKKDAPLV